mgnify:FL=1|tara:strand:- start:8 stop:247 length:240 start_codon:yes stop_codon:yes gene_type:complete
MENKLANDLVVSNIRYFETRIGVGYECKTQFGSIWNDGHGGDTYFTTSEPKYAKYRSIGEWDLERVIDKYEGHVDSNIK